VGKSLVGGFPAVPGIHLSRPQKDARLPFFQCHDLVARLGGWILRAPARRVRGFLTEGYILCSREGRRLIIRRLETRRRRSWHRASAVGVPSGSGNK
jgi:hypothetical protein